VAGKDVPIQEVGDASSAPLNLGLAVDLSTAMADHQDELSRQLARFSLRIADGQGEAFLATATDPPDWGTSPNQLAAAVADMQTAGETNLADLVATASGAFEDRRGRSFLVVVTDGGDIASKADWKTATAAAENAGVPVFVIGLRDTGFGSRARSNLGRLADTTGGRRYFLADPGMLQMTLDYIGELIDASYALRFARPGGEKPGPLQIKVGGVDRAWQVDSPSRIP